MRFQSYFHNFNTTSVNNYKSKTHMNNTSAFGSASLLVIFAVTVAIILLSIYGGIFISRLRGKSSTPEDEIPVNPIVGATLALLGFMLAFAFSITANRFDTRRQLLLDEVNSIGTTYLRAGLLPEPHCKEVRELIRKYVDLRIDLVIHPEKINSIIPQSVDLQNGMWNHAETVTRMDLKNPEIVALFMVSLNETIDLQTSRLTVAYIHRIPDLIWYALLALVILSMFGLGYLFMRSRKPNWILILAISIAFSVVIAMVIIFDRNDGTVKVNQLPMIELQKSINK
jgi:hypothetical protein